MTTEQNLQKGQNMMCFFTCSKKNQVADKKDTHPPFADQICGIVFYGLP